MTNVMKMQGRTHLTMFFKLMPRPVVVTCFHFLFVILIVMSSLSLLLAVHQRAVASTTKPFRARGIGKIIPGRVFFFDPEFAVARCRKFAAQYTHSIMMSQHRHRMVQVTGDKRMGAVRSP
ncbi:MULTISPECIES: hypothetical protein [Pseudomonas]|uniref:hypothetical protein n=1 Tax=Pseudomonas TaxID=286 RepID=UPI00117A267B|nr:MULTISPECIES: hypothetical protein [Pseudomonas]UST78287.1 hypothetical protein NF676_19235 [Pseudomonas siliginis]UST99164.1 hypothetical protein NF680_18430 [Pseudomonas siliginis]